MGSDPLANVTGALREHDYAIDAARFESRDVVVARRSQFKVRWMFSRLHTFVFVIDFGDEDVTAATLTHLVDLARGYAIKKKGGLPRGLQSGTAAIVVALSRAPSPALLAWSSRNAARRFAAMTFPVAVNTTTGTLTHPRPALVGYLFNAHLAHVADDIVGVAVHSR